MARLLPMLDPLEEIRKLYFSTTRETIERDLSRALELLKQMPSDEARQRAAGYMHGLTDLKREWSRKKRKKRKPARPAQTGRTGARSPQEPEKK